MSTTYGILYKNGINYSHDTAESISYSNTLSGLLSTNLKDVIDEVKSRLLPTGGTNTKYLRGDVTWQTPDNTTYTVMSVGTTGLVPTGGTTATFLRGDGWQTSAAFNTTYSVGNGGLVRKLDSNTSHYFRGDGAWGVPTDTTYDTMSVGTTGLVPTGGTSAKFLRGDGWQTSAAFNTTYGVGAGGLATKLNSDTDNYLRGNGTWATPTDTDAKISQTFLSNSGHYHYVLYSYSANDTTETNQVRKGGMIYDPQGYVYLMNPSSDFSLIQCKLIRINDKSWVYKNASQNLAVQSSTNSTDTNNYGVDIGVADSAWCFRPHQNNNMHCGVGSRRWKAVYATNGTIQTSDRNQKENILELDENKAEQFIMDLKPVSYKFKNTNDLDKHDRTHYGLIAQDVEETMNKMGMTALDFGGFCKDQKMEEYFMKSEANEETDPDSTQYQHKAQRPIEGEYIYSLRYDEFLAPMIKTIQNRQKKLDEQESLIQLLESKISQLENETSN